MTGNQSNICFVKRPNGYNGMLFWKKIEMEEIRQ